MGAQTIFGRFAQGGTAITSGLVASAVATSFTNDAHVGVGTWGANGSNFTAGTDPANPTQYLLCSGFGFSIPSNATILAIEARFSCQALINPPASDFSITLFAAGAPVSTGFAFANSWGAGVTPRDFVDARWGAAGWTPAQINAASFGIAISAVGSITGGIVQVLTPVTALIYYSVPAVSGIAIADTQPSTSQWTNGATAIAAISAGPQLTTPWDITSWSLSYLGQLVQASASRPAYGALGKLWGGLIPSSTGNTQGAGAPWVNPVAGFPNDMSSFTPIWDGQADPPFPWAPAPANTLRSITFPLPIPIRMQPGDQLAIGLWLTPSLAQNTQIVITNVNYSISYDDGV